MSYFRILTTLVFGAGMLGAQVDPGPRPGPARIQGADLGRQVGVLGTVLLIVIVLVLLGRI